MVFYVVVFVFFNPQLKMIEPKKELSNEHTFGSRPSWWPLMRRGVAFWIAKENNVRFPFLTNFGALKKQYSLHLSVRIDDAYPFLSVMSNYVFYLSV